MKPEHTIDEQKKRLESTTGETRAEVVRSILPALTEDEFRSTLRQALADQDGPTVEALAEQPSFYPEYVKAGLMVENMDYPDGIFMFLLEHSHAVESIVQESGRALEWSNILGIARLPSSDLNHDVVRELTDELFTHEFEPDWWEGLRYAVENHMDDDVDWLVQSVPGKFNLSVVDDLVGNGYIAQAETFMKRTDYDLRGEYGRLARLALQDERSRNWVFKRVDNMFGSEPFVNLLIEAHETTYNDQSGEAEHSVLKPFVEQVRPKKLSQLIKKDVTLQKGRHRDLVLFLINELDDVSENLLQYIADELIRQDTLDRGLLSELSEQGLDLDELLRDRLLNDDDAAETLAGASLQTIDWLLYTMDGQLVDELLRRATRTDNFELVHYLTQNWATPDQVTRQALLAEAVLSRAETVLSYWADRAGITNSQSTELLDELFSQGRPPATQMTTTKKVTSTVIEHLAEPDDPARLYRTLFDSFNSGNVGRVKDICKVLTRCSMPPPKNELNTLTNDEAHEILNGIEPHLTKRQQDYLRSRSEATEKHAD